MENPGPQDAGTSWQSGNVDWMDDEWNECVWAQECGWLRTLFPDLEEAVPFATDSGVYVKMFLGPP